MCLYVSLVIFLHCDIKKLASVSLPSVINLMFLWKEFTASK